MTLPFRPLDEADVFSLLPAWLQNAPKTRQDAPRPTKQVADGSRVAPRFQLPQIPQIGPLQIQNAGAGQGVSRARDAYQPLPVENQGVMGSGDGQGAFDALPVVGSARGAKDAYHVAKTKSLPLGLLLGMASILPEGAGAAKAIEKVAGRGLAKRAVITAADRPTPAIRLFAPGKAGELVEHRYTGAAHPFARLDAEAVHGDLLDENFEPKFRIDEGFIHPDGKTWMDRKEAFEYAKANGLIGGNPKAVANVKRTRQMKAEALKRPTHIELKDMPTVEAPSDAEIAAKIARLRQRFAGANGEYADQLKQDLEILQKRSPKQAPGPVSVRGGGMGFPEDPGMTGIGLDPHGNHNRGTAVPERVAVRPPAEIARVGEVRNSWIKDRMAELQAQGRNPVRKRGQIGPQSHIVADALVDPRATAPGLSQDGKNLGQQFGPGDFPDRARLQADYVRRLGRPLKKTETINAVKHPETGEPAFVVHDNHEGAQWETLQHAGPEKIKSAALRLPNGEVFEANSHMDAILEAEKRGHNSSDIYDYFDAHPDDSRLFRTTHGRLVTPEEAGQIAKARKQVAPEYRADANEFGDDTQLASEWLKPLPGPSKGFGLQGHIPEQKPLTYFRGPKTKPQDLADAFEMSRRVFDANGPFAKWLKAGREYPGAGPWYDTREMYRDAADAIGEDAAAKKVNALLGGFMPASTARSTPPSNLKRAFLWQALADQKLITPDVVKNRKIVLPKGFGHYAQTTAHQPAIARFMETGAVDPLINPKPASFGQDLTGNMESGTFDTVMGEIAREIDPKMNRFFGGGEEGKSPKKWAYAPLERGLADAAHDAKQRGILDFDPDLSPVASYQSLGWHGQTRSAEYGSMIDIWRRMLKESADAWGVSQKRANELIWKEGKVPLLKLDSPLLKGTKPYKKKPK